MLNRDEIRYNPDDFLRISSVGNADCAYIAFGIERRQAFLDLSVNLNLVKHLLLPLVHEVFAMQGQDFLQFLKERNIQNDDLEKAYLHFLENGDFSSVKQIVDSNEILRAYLQYDVLYGRIDSGWGHPMLLQAVALVRDINLRIYRNEGDYYVQQEVGGVFNFNPEGDEIISLLLSNYNHFERLVVNNQRALGVNPG